MAAISTDDENVWPCLVVVVVVGEKGRIVLLLLLLAEEDVCESVLETAQIAELDEGGLGEVAARPHLKLHETQRIDKTVTGHVAHAHAHRGGVVIVVVVVVGERFEANRWLLGTERSACAKQTRASIDLEACVQLGARQRVVVVVDHVEFEARASVRVRRVHVGDELTGGEHRRHSALLHEHHLHIELRVAVGCHHGCSGGGGGGGCREVGGDDRLVAAESHGDKGVRVERLGRARVEAAHSHLIDGKDTRLER